MSDDGGHPGHSKALGMAGKSHCKERHSTRGHQCCTVLYSCCTTRYKYAEKKELGRCSLGKRPEQGRGAEVDRTGGHR